MPTIAVMRPRMRPLLLLIPLFLLAALAPSGAPAATTAAWAGGASAPSRSGGTEFRAPLGRPSALRPSVALFRVAPRSIVEGTAPRVSIRIAQRGVRTVRARLVFWPVGKGKLLTADLGRIRVGRVVRPKLPGALVPGSYVVRLHAVGPGGGTLIRRARASGRASLTVRTKPKPPPPPPPPPAPAPDPAPAAPSASGVFPVAGAWTFGGDDGRFGAGRRGHTHEGQDISAASGTPVVAPVAGTIAVRSFQKGGAGHYLVLDAADGRSMFFAHLLEGSLVVREGQAVAAGQRIASVGSTGSSTGPHLHFELWTGGWRRTAASRPVDPLPQLRAWAG